MHLVCREWGVQASRLANAVDEVTIGSTHHVSQVLSAVQSNDGVEESLEELMDFTRTLQDVSESAVMAW